MRKQSLSTRASHCCAVLISQIRFSQFHSLTSWEGSWQCCCTKLWEASRQSSHLHHQLQLRILSHFTFTHFWSKIAFILSCISSFAWPDLEAFLLGKPSENSKQLTRSTSLILMKLSELEWSNWNLWSRVMFGSLSKWERHTTDVPRQLSWSLSFI